MTNNNLQLPFIPSNVEYNNDPINILNNEFFSIKESCFNQFQKCDSKTNCFSDNEEEKNGDSALDPFQSNFNTENLNKNNEYDELEEDKQRFYNSEEIKKENKKEKKFNIKKFNVSKNENDEKNQFIGRKTNRGRKKNKEKMESNEINGDAVKKEHTKFDVFNILNKIKVHSINSAIDGVNKLLDFKDHDKNERFKKINAGFKKKVNKKEIEELKKKKLYEIVQMNISPKYTKFPVDYNKQLYNKIKKEPKYNEIISFLDETYLSFFQNVYYKTERSIDLKKYNLDALVPLSKEVKLSIDQLQSFEEKEYVQLYKKCVNDYFFDGKLMFQLE